MATAQLKSSIQTVVALLGAVVLSMLFMAVPSAEATHVEPELKPGNPACGDFEPEGESWTQLRVDGESDGGPTDELDSGTYSDGTLTVEVTVRDTEDGPVLDWDANLDVDAVVVKGGPNGNLYEYDPEVASDTGLHSPFNDDSEKYYGLSHVSFCYDVEQPPEGPAEIDLTVDKVNDASGDGTFSDSEAASSEGASVDFRVTVAVPAGAEAPVDLSSASDVYPTGDGDSSNDTERDLFDLCDELSDGTVIAPGESVTCTFTLTDYAPAPGESIQDTVTVEGHEEGDADNTVADQDDSSVTTPSQPPAGPPAVDLTVDKVNDANQDGTFSDTESAPAEGEDVDFRVTITNPNSSDVPVDLDSATDTYPTDDGDASIDITVDLFDIDTEDCALSDDTVLAPGESVECTFTLTDYAPAPGESIDDTVAVEGHHQGNADNTVSDQDDSTVTTTPPPPPGEADIALTVEKVNDAGGDGSFSDSETAPAPGAAVDFRVTITNPETSETSVDLSSATDAYPTNDGDTSNDSTVDLFDIDTEDCDLSDDTVLEPGESETCTFTIEDYGPPAGESIVDTVTVEGHELDNPDNTTSDQDDSTVTTPPEEVLGDEQEREEEADLQPGISVTKTALVSPGAAGEMVVTFNPDDGDDETVSYRYVVTNTGDTTLEQVALTDDVLGAITLEDTTLEPGQSTSGVATHVLTEADADAGHILNVATVVGVAPDGEQVTDDADAAVLVAEVQSAVASAGDVEAAAEDDEQLPVTGADPLGWASLGVGLIVLGGAALLATRLRAARG